MDEECCSEPEEEEQECQCCSKGEYGSGHEMTEGLMSIADDAWEELMREKLKAHFEKLKGPHMDKLAKAVVEASLIYWKKKMAGDHELDSAFMKIREIIEEGQ